MVPMTSENTMLKVAVPLAVVTTILLSLSPLFVGDLSWLGIDARKYSNEMNNAGSWMAGVGALVLQMLALYLLYRTYHREKDEAVRLRFESELSEVMRQYEVAVSMLKYDDTKGTYSVLLDRRVHEGRPTFRIYLEMLKKIHVTQGEDGLKKWLYDYDDYIGGWRRSVFAVVRHIINHGEVVGDVKGGYLNSLRFRFSDNESAVMYLLLSVYPVRGGSAVAKYLLQNDFFRYAHLDQRLGEHYDVIRQAVSDKHDKPTSSETE